MHLRRRVDRSLIAASLLWLSLGATAAADGPAAGPGAAPSKPPPVPLTFERLFGGESLTGPMPEGLSWRPAHDEYVMWRGEKGDRTLWAVDAATGTEKKLVAVSEFDSWLKARDPKTGVPMRGVGRAGPPSMLWAPSGDAIFLTLHGDIYRKDLVTGRTMRLTETKSPISDIQIAPDGLHLSFARDHDLWAVVIKPAEWKTDQLGGWGEPTIFEIRLTTGGSETIRNGDLDWVYPEELDCKTAAWWSPDSTRVAFLQLDETKVSKFPIVDYMPRLGDVYYEQYPKAGDANPVPRVGVVGLDGKPPVWVELSTMEAIRESNIYVPWMVWLPEGRRLAVLVLNRKQDECTLGIFNVVGEHRLSFLGAGGGGYWIDVPSPPHFLTKPEAFVWIEDFAGLRPALVSIEEGTMFKGTQESLLPDRTPVGQILAIDESTGALFYEAPSDDLLHSLVWRTTLDRARPVPVTDDAVSHHASFSDDAKWFLDTESQATVPPKITLRKADGTAVRVIADSMTPEFASWQLEPPEFGRVPAKGDLPDLPYVLWKPRHFDPSKHYPVIVHLYGGPGARLVKDDYGGLFNALLAENGFAVFTLDNRGSGGRGKAFEATIYKRLGTVELEDQVRGVDWLERQPWVDGSRVGIWGWSYGGYMTCYAMTRAPGVFKAGVAVAPVTDWRLYDTIYTERYMGTPQENPEGYKNSSPITFAKDLQGALLLCHGLSDDNVHVQNTIQFAEALIQAGKKFDLMLYPHRAHGIEGKEAHIDLFRRILEHFKRNL